jgi:hypothetical protein
VRRKASRVIFAGLDELEFIALVILCSLSSYKSAHPTTPHRICRKKTGCPRGIPFFVFELPVVFL